MPLISRGAIYDPPSPEFPQVAIGFSGEGKVIFAQAVENEAEGAELLREFSKAQRDEFNQRRRATTALEGEEIKDATSSGR